MKRARTENEVQDVPVHYLLCGTHPDDTESLSGYVFTPTSKDGQRVIDALFMLEHEEQSEAMQILTSFYEIETETEKEKRRILKKIRAYFPALPQEVHPRELGSLEEWKQADRRAVVPLYVSYEY